MAALIVLAPFCPRAGELYQVRGLSEEAIVGAYTMMLVEAYAHADQFWKASAFDPAAGYWGNGLSDGNEGIRAIGEMVLTCGTLVRYADALSGKQRQDCLSKAKAAIRYATTTHRTGRQRCTDGKPWGGSWQSAMWTGTLGFGAWLVWGELDTGLREEVEWVVASEADRFLPIHPPSGLWGDTKAEENGWDLICIALAANLFPDHPHAAAWQDKAREYMMNTLSTAQDLHDMTVLEGRAVQEWVCGANLQPDYTLENHNIYHPSYVACSSYFLTQTAMYYAYARRTVPQTARHHLMDTWRRFEPLLLPCGESAYPQGMDWELHGLSFINLYAALASYQQDALAARLEAVTLQYLRAWQTMCRGDLAVPGSRLGFCRHAICAEQLAYGLLAHKIFGPPARALSARKAAAQLAGTRDYPYVDFISHRTRDKFVSFSWKNRIMGLLIPIGTGHEGNPHLTVPIVSGFVGSIELAPRGETGTTVLEHARNPTATGFETTGTLLINGGRLKQRLRVTSIGEKAVVYQDRITAVSAVTVTRERGIPVGIENDALTGGRRVVSYAGGEMVFDWQERQRSAAIPGQWANVDGRLGVIVVTGSGLAYTQASGYDPHMAVCTDLLYGSCSDDRKQYQAGAEVMRRLVLFYTEVPPRQTAALAKSCRVLDQDQGEILRFKLPEGGEVEIPLL